jgi:uncharacterized membrane-anchored protein
MSGKKTIRIVKKGAKDRQPTVIKKNSARETAREMVETVTNWVNEFQQRRRAETAAALKLASQTPPPTRA